MSLLTAPAEPTAGNGNIAGLFSLAGRSAMITGGIRGIGLAVAHGFLSAGLPRLAILHSRANTLGDATASVELLTSLYPAADIRAYAVDITDAADVDAATRTIAWTFAGLDICVVNAGIYSDAPALDMAPAEARAVTDVNYFGALWTAQSAARVMRAQHRRGEAQRRGGGKIIFTASINAHIVLRPQRESIYCATKAGVLHLARALAVEFAPLNINVNSVSPGYIDTAMNDLMIAKYPDQVAGWLQDCPAGRFCKVWELAGVYVFLASRAGSYVTGGDYKVDGGHTCH
ncbi:hypothetical protein EDC01DRAFT_287255 [Geopyxis carbonaria]|nr:hypothetical protein EDC01DRAFT_287255 [Geopyxis carbonaria]